MAQAFVTTYNQIYRRHPIDKRKSLRPIDTFLEQIPDGDIWLLPKKIGEHKGGVPNITAEEDAIKRMYRKRMWSTYQFEYCPEMIPREAVEEGGSFDSALLFYCQSLYGSKTQKILPPLPTARRLYGYVRPTKMYFPLTTYQSSHGKVGYQILDSHSHPKSDRENSKAENQQNVNVEDAIKTSKNKVTTAEDKLKKTKSKTKFLNLCSCTCAATDH